MEGLSALNARGDSMYLAKNLLHELVRGNDAQFRKQILKNKFNNIDDVVMLRKTAAVLTEKIIV